MLIFFNNQRLPRRIDCTSCVAIAIATAILVYASPIHGQTNNDDLPIIIEVTGSADELHWPVVRRTHSTPFAEVQPIIGPEVAWHVDENGHLTSTISARLQSSGKGNDGVLDSVMEVHHNYEFAPCAICPATGVSVTETSNFWVPQPPGTQVWITRDASRTMFDLSTFTENPYIDVSTIGPNVFTEITTSYRVGGPIDLGLNRTSKTTLVGQNVPPNSLHEGVWTALTSSTTKSFDGVQYSLGLTLKEVVNVDMNINTGFGLSGMINAKSMVRSNTKVSYLLPEPALDCFEVLWAPFECPEDGFEADFDYTEDGVNDSMRAPTLRMLDPSGKMHPLTDDEGNVIELICFQDDTDLDDFHHLFIPLLIPPHGERNGLGNCEYGSEKKKTIGVNSFTICFDDKNGNGVPDKFRKSRWVTSEYNQDPVTGDPRDFTGKSTTYVADLTKEKIVPIRTETTNSFAITDAKIVDLGTDLSSLTLNGESLIGEARDELREENHAATLDVTMEAFDDTVHFGSSFQTIAAVRNMDSIPHVYNISLFGINASVATVPPADFALAAGEVRYFSFLATAVDSGDAALAMYVWAETGNAYDNWGDAVVITVVPEPATCVLLLAVAVGNLTRRQQRIM